jgi:hypothetical protein
VTHAQVQGDQRTVPPARHSPARSGANGEPWYGPCGTSEVGADLEPGYRLAGVARARFNTGLRALGVRAVSGQDEYETIGLARLRTALSTRCCWTQRQVGRTARQVTADMKGASTARTAVT